MSRWHWAWMLSLLGLSACAAMTADAPPPAPPLPSIPGTTVRWISTISFPNLFDYPAVYRGEFRSPEQCKQAFRATVAMLANHKSNGTISPCALGVATVELPE